MNLNFILQIIQTVISIILVVLVLIQGKGTGLSSAFSNSFGYYRSRRGVERLVFVSTIVLGVALVVNSLLLVLIQ